MLVTGKDDVPSRADAVRDVEHEVGVIIRRVRRLASHRAQVLHPSLQTGSYLLISWLEQTGPVRASTLSDQFDVDKGAISRQVKHLVDLGLIRAERDPADARAFLLSLTDDARSRLAEVTEQRRSWFDDKLADWSADELAAFASMLARYNATLNAD